MPTDTPILAFYRLRGTDSEGRRLDEIWAWDHAHLEQVHDFIQWMFPLDEPSSVNPDAPLLTESDRAAFADDPALRSSVRKSLAVFLDFLGLQIDKTGHVTKAPHFARRIAVWKYSNHNWLRITRMLKSLRLLDHEAEAQQVWQCLKQLHEKDGYVTDHSFAYWQSAAEHPI